MPATKIGVPVNITVLDAGAHLKAFSRMHGAVLGSIELSSSKARTSVLFSIPSETVWGTANTARLQQELKPYGIKVQTINPGAFYTGYNETMADAPFRRLDDTKNVTKRAALRAELDAFLHAPEGHLDAREMIDRMIDVVPADTGRFRNVVPKAVEDMLKVHQVAAWQNSI